jgi:hypothetical protein
MQATLTWGSWEDTWVGGRFVSVFVAAKAVDGWIEACGLYYAKDGDKITDLETLDEQIASRALIIRHNNETIRVRAEFAENIALLPTFLNVLDEGVPLHL